jgi:MHS family proline/betaine transporter-like MFS transporter
MTAIADGAVITPRQSVGRAVFAATIGNVLEWYDFTIYAAFALSISKTFFPTDNEVVSLMLSFATFAIGFVARPFGAVLLGSYADNRGRRDALSLTILLMALGTGIIAVCPGYAAIGMAAPAIIVLARLIQGFSAGGEIGGAISTLVEYAPPQKRGLYASLTQMSIGGSTLLSGLVAFAISRAMTPEATEEWGWRLAFVVGLTIAPIGLYIRRELEDAPLFKSAEHADEMPALMVLRDHWRTVLSGMLIVMLWTVAQYITNYFPTFAVRELRVPLSQSYLGPVVFGTVMLCCPLVGMLADRFSRKSVMVFGALGLLAVAYPAFSYLIAAPSTERVVITQIGVAVFLLIYTAPAAAVLAELFSTAVRATGVSVSFSLGVSIFGGFTPLILTALINWTRQPISVALYLMGAATISLITVILLKDRTAEVLS